MSRIHLLATCLLVLVLAACGGQGADNTTPEGAVKATVSALQKDDLHRALATALPPEAWIEFEQEWMAQQSEPVDEQQAAEFNEMMTKLTAEGAEQDLLTMVKPQLAMAQGQVEQMAGMFTMLTAGAVPEGLSAEEQQKAEKTMAAIGRWLASVDLTDEAKAEEAVGIVVATARELELPDYQAARALSLEQALDKGGVAMGGLKRVLALYDLDVQAVLDSVAVGSAEVEGETATVPVTVTILGEEHTMPLSLQQIAGRWYGAGDETETLDEIPEE